jgi:hypothetical protein
MLWNVKKKFITTFTIICNSLPVKGNDDTISIRTEPEVRRLWWTTTRMCWPFFHFSHRTLTHFERRSQVSWFWWTTTRMWWPFSSFFTQNAHTFWATITSTMTLMNHHSHVVAFFFIFHAERSHISSDDHNHDDFDEPPFACGVFFFQFSQWTPTNFDFPSLTSELNDCNENFLQRTHHSPNIFQYRKQKPSAQQPHTNKKIWVHCR